MRLLDLEPRFVRYDVRMEEGVRVRAGVDPTRYTEADLERAVWPHVYYVHVGSLAEAHGLQFLCPKCFAENHGAEGTHGCLCWFEDRVPADAEPGPGRWNPTGTWYHDLSFVPGKKSNSVALLGGCNAHFFITGGMIK